MARSPLAGLRKNRPPSERPKKACARANVSFILGVAATIFSIAAAFLSTAQCGSVGSTPLFVCAVAFLVLAVLAWFQRSLEQQIIKFAAENGELKDTRERLGAENDKLEETRGRLDAENDELKNTQARLDAENVELKGTRERLDAENAEFDAENKKLAVQVQQLNRLHNDEVALIRQLALYGDECKEFGRELKDVSSSLKDTDGSLGSTADELKKEVGALSAVVGAITKARARASGLC